MGLGFKGDTGHHHSISENIESIKIKYGFSKGYFGELGGRCMVASFVGKERRAAFRLP